MGKEFSCFLSHFFIFNQKQAAPHNTHGYKQKQEVMQSQDSRLRDQEK